MRPEYGSLMSIATMLCGVLRVFGWGEGGGFSSNDVMPVLGLTSQAQTG